MSSITDNDGLFAADAGTDDGFFADVSADDADFIAATDNVELTAAIAELAAKFAKVATEDLKVARAEYEEANAKYYEAIRNVKAAIKTADEAIVGPGDADTRSNRFFLSNIIVCNVKIAKRNYKHAAAIAECNFYEAQWDASKAVENANTARKVLRSIGGGHNVLRAVKARTLM